jgi:hypothetical protein
VKNVVNRLVPYNVAKKTRATDVVYVLREIRLPPRQPMFELIMLSGEPKKMEEGKLGGFTGRCSNPWCATGEWGITMNGEEIAKNTQHGLLFFTKKSEWLNSVGDRILVQGGHFMPDLKGASDSAWAAYGLEIALKIVETAWQWGKKADLFMLVNDLAMGKRSENREEYWFEFGLPKEMQGMIAACRERVGKNFGVFIAGESFLSNHMQKYVIPKLGNETVCEIQDIVVERNRWKTSEKDERESGQRKCRAAITQLYILAGRFYDGLVQIYPACGREQCERAQEVFRLVEKDADALNVLNIYAGKKCWGSGCLNQAAKDKTGAFLHELLQIL